MSEPKLSLFFLGDDRNLESDIFEAEYTNNTSILNSVFAASVLHALEEKNNNINREIALKKSIKRTEEWMREQALKGANQGAENVHTIYEEIISGIILSSNTIVQDELSNLSNTLSQILEEIFLIRATNEALQLNMRWLSDFGGCCQVKKNQVIFDSETFIQKYLNKNSRMSEKSSFITTLEELRTKKLKDIRYQIHGHDFIELFCWFIRPYLRKEIRTSYNSEILAGSLLGCVDADYLVQETLFQKLLARMGN